ncbi:MAG: SDR family NAD(P)-dependent oxidoreductase [Methylococcales bacterium]
MKRCVLITGASSGIGQAVARALLAKDHRVIGVSRTIQESAFENPHFRALRIDLADLENLPDRCSEILKSHPDLDSAVLCAGAGRFGCLEEFSCDQIRQLMDLNFTSPAFIARSLVPHFKRKPRSDLIFIGSEASLRGSRKGTIYCATKFALRGFSQALRDECGKSGLRVSLINPGMVKTRFFDELDFTHGESPNQAIEAEDVAEVVCSIFDLRAETVLDEINLSPQNKVIRFKSWPN